MPQRVLPEYSGKELVYTGALGVVRKLGYDFGHERQPLEDRYTQEIGARVARQDGAVSTVTHRFSDRRAATQQTKNKALALGADMVGATHVDPYYIYKDREVPHRYAIVMAFAMDYDQIKRVPNKTNQEWLRVYNDGSKTAVDLAEYIRSLGYPARAHTLYKEDLAMIPHAYAAGLGELGKHGSLINNTLGPCFRLAVVTTDLPLVEDSPKIEGVDDFCTNCQVCVNYCPGDAISHNKQSVRGVYKWVVDTVACAPYWASYEACGICIQVCPWNARGFTGQFRATYGDTMKGIELEEMRARLQAGVQEPWTLIDGPPS